MVPLGRNRCEPEDQHNGVVCGSWRFGGRFVTCDAIAPGEPKRYVALSAASSSSPALAGGTSYSRTRTPTTHVVLLLLG